VVHESHWEANCSNGLDEYQFHCQQVFYEDLPVLNIGHQYTHIGEYDLSSNPWIHNWDEIGITVYLHDRDESDDRNVGASWELGEVTLGDMNGDLSITMADKPLFINAYGSEWWQPKYNPAGDWDMNGMIDSYDRDLFIEYIQNDGMR